MGSQTLLPAQSHVGFGQASLPPDSTRHHKTAAAWYKSSLSNFAGMAEPLSVPKRDVFLLAVPSGYTVWCCPWHPAVAAGQGDPRGGEVSKGLGPSSLRVPTE